MVRVDKVTIESPTPVSEAYGIPASNRTFLSYVSEVDDKGSNLR